ncbi:MAG: hypothetical protein NC822_05345 [Candidatus Omnitrophica bacterium]|nr:hypothetical protein [Candidatus Omnitrophota bacterium]MCM8827440.1 hypothetical protein [Candidatus Omnitrophota bacterium]
MIIKKRIDDLKEGVVLAKDIVNENGLLLVAKGTSLDEKLLSLLKDRGVKWVYVNVNIRELDQPLPKELEEEYKNIEERIDKKFKEFGDHYVMQKIAHSAKEYLKTRLFYK